jgi:multidrug efflux system membrane fusion protein
MSNDPNAPQIAAQTHAEGHQLGRRVPRRRPRHLGLAAIAALLLATTSAAWGIYSRHRAESALSDWTAKQAVPTVEVSLPTHSTVPRKLVLPGDVQAFYEAPIYARVAGYLASWSEDIGAHVKRGQTLGLIDTPDLDQELAQAQADLATAQARENFAALTAKRWHALLASQQSADEKQGDALAVQAEVAAQRAHLDRLRALESFKRLAAPFDGVVTARNTDVGALIAAGSAAPQPLFKVADMHEMRVYVRVPQAFASGLKKGLKATLTEPQYPGVSFPAILSGISDSVAMESRTVLVELQAPNADGKLWAGTFAEVQFQLPADPDVLRVPASALIFRSHGAQIATVDNSKVVLKDVVIGHNLGSEIEVEQGIGPADQVIVSPLDSLEDGEPVEVSKEEATGS